MDETSNFLTKSKRSIEFSQDSELIPIEKVIIHRPSMETFMSMLHPAGSLYMDVTSVKEVNENYDSLCELFKKYNIQVITVREALKLNPDTLKLLARNTLKYELYNPKNLEISKEMVFFLSDEYKAKVLDKLELDQLVDICFTRPTYVLEATSINTKVEFKDINFHPLGNLLYTRDQQITTYRGVVMGRLNSKVRVDESIIMKQVFENQDIDVIDSLPEDARLEGGDFIFARKDLAFLGIGMRTNKIAANHLLENDLFGIRSIALVLDENDNSQDRMHLDTFFNTPSKNTVVMLDMGEDPNTRRKMLLYEYNHEDDASSKTNAASYEEYESIIGPYKLKKVYDYIEDFLQEEGYAVVLISIEDQINFSTNFLSLGNKVILAVNPKLKEILKKAGVENIEVIDIDFEAVKKMYGGIHCATQVSRIQKSIKNVGRIIKVSKD